jgi:hypothetical protein
MFSAKRHSIVLAAAFLLGSLTPAAHAAEGNDGNTLAARQGTIQGMVVDRVTLRPLSGVQVFVQGTEIGALTGTS